MKHWQVRQKRNCKIKGAARQENIVDYYCMNYLFKSSHKVAQSYILFILRKKKYFCQLFTCLCLFSRLSICLFMYMQKKEFASTEGLSKSKKWLDHLLLTTSNLVTISLRSRRLEVVGTKKQRAREKEPVLSFARYFQAPATQAT